MAVPPNRNSPRKGVPKRQAELLDTATQVFFERGYEGSSTEEIAQRLGILKGSLYYYIDTKEDLLFSLIKQVFDRTLENLSETVDEPATVLGRLRKLIERHIIHLIATRKASALALLESRSLTAEHRDWLRSAETTYVSGFVSLIEAGLESGEIRQEIDPQLAALMILGAINWPYRWYQEDGDKTPEEIAQLFADTITRGLAS